jgi:hypothetical protein
MKVLVPLTEYSKLTEKDNYLGARVVPALDVHGALVKKAASYSPSLGDTRTMMSGGRRLEYFMADLLLGCKGGFRFTKNDEVPIQSIFYRRSGPIAAAIAVTVELPEDAELPDQLSRDRAVRVVGSEEQGEGRGRGASAGNGTAERIPPPAALRASTSPASGRGGAAAPLAAIPAIPHCIASAIFSAAISVGKLVSALRADALQDAI